MIDLNRFKIFADKRDFVQKKINKNTGFDNKEQKVFSFDIAILTATPDEFESVKKICITAEEFEPNNNDSIIYFKGLIKGKKNNLNVIIPFPQGAGITAATSLTTKILDFNPKYVFMVGIAAGNKNITKIGDILIAEKAINYNEVVEIQKKDNVGIKKFMQNADSINANLLSKLSIFSKSNLIKELKLQYPENQDINYNTKCVSGLIVTGSSLIRSQEKMNEINQSYHGVIGLDMETYGIYYTCTHSLINNQPMFVSIKAVSDFGDDTNHKLSASKRKDYALYTSSNFVKYFIENYL